MKYTIISYTTLNGLEEIGVVIKSLGTVGNITQNLCYGNHKLFILESYTNYYRDEEGRKSQEEILSYGGTIVEDAVLPKYDQVLEKVALSHEISIRNTQELGYTRAEAINILKGKKPDGSDFEKEWPF